VTGQVTLPFNMRPPRGAHLAPVATGVRRVAFSELVRLLEQHGFKLLKQKGSVRYYAKPGVDRLIRVDYHASKEVPTGTCQAVLKSAYIRPGGRR
jgi:predicted RNA binding protein YcfA (HicA-like mRNA interferase family)